VFFVFLLVDFLSWVTGEVSKKMIDTVTDINALTTPFNSYSVTDTLLLLCFDSYNFLFFGFKDNKIN
jgi:hypothetical protein